MKFLFASDSFKGTIPSARVAELLSQAAHKMLPDCETVGIPVADGGEGTVEAVLGATGGTRRTVKVHNPLMEEVESSYGMYKIYEPDGTVSSGAIIEMSAASSLTMIPDSQRNPLNTTTYGTGELIRDAIEQGCRNISIAIGGSATNDGGIGAMRALGIRFLDSDSNELFTVGGTGRDLANIAFIDTSGLIPEICNTEITVLCDVDNYLTGPDGATFTFGRQKCSSAYPNDEVNEILSELEAGMSNYLEVLRVTFGMNANEIPGSGAAGGLGAALGIMLGARMNSGIESVLSIINFDRFLDGVDLCITGEGKLDWQSSHGKTITGIAAHCRARNIPVTAIVGCTGEGYEDVHDIGISRVLCTCDEAPSPAESMSDPEGFYISCAEKYFREIAETGKI